MSSPHLPNYVRAQRKRLALTQDDVAFLLGVQTGAKVCRYERFVRVPTLETALALEIILQKPVRELFGGLFEKMEKKVTDRAKALSYQLRRGKTGAQRERRSQALLHLISTRKS